MFCCWKNSFLLFCEQTEVSASNSYISAQTADVYEPCVPPAELEAQRHPSGCVFLTCSSLCFAFRWVKFEEKVEEGGERWSKPHVSTLSLHSLFELRTCLQTGTVLLDLEGYSLPQIVGEPLCTNVSLQR